MKEDKVVYAMALLAVLSVAGLLLFELALSPKARYPLTVTRVQQVQQVLQGEEVQQGEGVLVPYGEEQSSFPMNINQATAEDLMEADPDWGEARTGHPGLHRSARRHLRYG